MWDICVEDEAFGSDLARLMWTNNIGTIKESHQKVHLVQIVQNAATRRIRNLQYGDGLFANTDNSSRLDKQ